jgi:hypothetical protein
MRPRGLSPLTLALALAACGDTPPDRGAVQLASDGTPSLRFEPPAHAFGLVEVGQLAKETLALVNDGDAPASIGELAATGAGFALVGTTCGTVLDPGARCDVRIRFEPAALEAYAGGVGVVADGEAYEAPVAGTGAWRLEVATAGTGGQVASTPAGISCGAACSALFPGDVVLTATGSAVVWSLPGCAGAVCAVPAQAAPVSVTATFASSLLAIDLAGTGAGEVQLRTLGATVATCAGACAVPLVEGQGYELVAVTPSRSQLAGVCSGTVACAFTAGPGAQSATATFSLDAASNEEWAVLLPEGLHTAAFDSAGNLIVGSGGGVHKLSPAGATLWSVPIAPTVVATGPGDTIYVHAGASLVKLDPAGGVIWTSPIPPGADGCVANPVFPDLAFVHCLGVAPDGAAAIHGTSLIARWDAAGALAWTRPMPDDGYFTMAIDGQGVVHATVESPATFEEQDALRFAPDGTPLPAIEGFCAQYHGMISTGFGGQPFCTSSGHSNVYGVGSLPLDDPDYVPTGLAHTGLGHWGWVFYLDDAFLPFGLTWRMARYTASGGLVWAKLGGLLDMVEYAVGTVPADVAGSSTGRLALAGMFIDPTGQVRGWVSSFAP